MFLYIAPFGYLFIYLLREIKGVLDEHMQDKTDVGTFIVKITVDG